jgi:hypothetical protein
MLELHDGGSVCFIFIPGRESIATVVETIEFAINPLLPQFGGCAQYLPHRIRIRERSSAYFIGKMWGIGQEEVGDVDGG